MATELENLVPEADVEVEGMRGPKGDKGDSYVLTEADKEEIARKVDTIIDAETDKTLSISGKPADAKAAGDAIDDLKADYNKLTTATAEDVGKALKAKTVTDGKVTEWEFGEAGGADPAVIEQAVTDWLNAHPEATTTVTDGSITTVKLADWTVPFVYPEQFGAVGDGATDDAPAIQSAINYCIQTGKDLIFMPKTYGVIPYQQDKSVIIYNSALYALIINGRISIDFNGAVIKLLTNTIKGFTVIHLTDADGVVLKNGTIIGDRDTFTISNDNSQLLDMFDCKNCVIDSIRMKDSKGDCFGHTGVQIDQPNTTREFEDFYMGNLITNCVMSHSTRHGMTFSKGRGVTFFNCRIENVRSEGQISYEGSAIDMEPYYGIGSVYDVRFIECSMTDNSNGPYVQNCTDVRFDNCFLQDIGFRSSINGHVDNCIIVGKVAINSSSAVFNSNRISSVITISNTIDILTKYGILADIYIVNNICENGIQVNTSRSDYLIGDIVIAGNTINKSDSNTAVIGVLGKNDTGEIRSVKIENNRLYNNYSGIASGGGNQIDIKKAPKVVVRNNAMLYDILVASQTSEVVACEKVGELVFNDNIIQFEEKQDGTYIRNIKRILRIKDIANNAIIQGNVVNPEGNTMSAFPLYLIRGETTTEEPPKAVVMNNYINGCTGINNANDGPVNMLVDFGNVVNNVITNAQ